MTPDSGGGVGGFSPLASRLRDGTRLTGLLLKMPAVAMAEMAGHSGFDLLVLDTEHGPGGAMELEHHLRAADATGIPVLVRVPNLDPAHILAALDAGAVGVVVPHVLGPDDARAVVAAAHYPPRGRRGMALSTRAGNYGRVPLTEHLRRSEEQTCVVVQIEDAEAVDAAGEILATDGVDGVLIGATDLSMSLGHPGSADHPEVEAAIDRVIALATARGVAVAVVAGSPAEASVWRERGASVALFVATQLFDQALTSVVRGARPAARPSPSEALILIPGTLGDADLWAEVMPVLADVASPRVPRIDLDDSIGAMAETVLASAPARFALAGHSQGAIVCLEILRRAPSRVTSVSLINASARPGAEQQLVDWENMRARVEAGAFEEVVAEFAAVSASDAAHGGPVRSRIVDMAHRVGRGGLLRQLAAQTTRPDSRPSLASIQCPTLVISSGDDHVCPPELQEELAAAIGGARLERLEGCGHMAPLEQPEKVGRLLREFLSNGA